MVPQWLITEPAQGCEDQNKRSGLHVERNRKRRQPPKKGFYVFPTDNANQKQASFCTCMGLQIEDAPRAKPLQVKTA